jgi:hypothetical protein
MCVAQKTIVKTYDDLDGSEIDAGGKSITFSIEGSTYEIDLSSKNVDKMRQDFAVYTQKARKVSNRAGRGSAKAEPAPLDTRAVRAWAEEQGIEVSARGRLSSDLIERYRAAH